MNTHKDTAIETAECEAKAASDYVGMDERAAADRELDRLEALVADDKRSDYVGMYERAAADRDYWRSLASQHGQELGRLETLLTDAKGENAALKEELQAHKAALEKAGNVITVYSTFVRGLHTV